MKKLVFIGNFEPPYSTENDLKWTFENLGWVVKTIQENGPWPTVWGEPHIRDIDLLLYVHTHGWGSEKYIGNLINSFKSMEIKTCSFHLDRYWGLDQADRRESRVGEHPFWYTDYVFTADGGNDERFKERGVPHYWLKPGVVERDCYMGTYRPELACDIAFVGSKHYHPEYPERTELINWLERTYPDNFRRYAGDTPYGTMRGQDLNDLYASVKVCVGDSCFAGRAQNYWSDRVAETTGRGGFLLHPEVEGLDHSGVAKYKAGDFDELQSKIEFFLSDDSERNRMRERGHKWTKKHATYTNRVKEMIDVMGL